MTEFKEDLFSLPEGDVSIRWPTPLSKESFEDVVDWLEIFKRKIGRFVNETTSSFEDVHFLIDADLDLDLNAH